MATERISTLVQLFYLNDSQKVVKWREFHNGEPDTTITHNKIVYKYLPFIYSGATVSLTGDNVQAELTLSSNDIARSNVANLVSQNYRAKVYVCRMSADFERVNNVLSVEEWLVSSAVYDSTAIQIELSSGLDAVNANTPRRVLTGSDVGPLPVTGNVRL